MMCAYTLTITLKESSVESMYTLILIKGCLYKCINPPIVNGDVGAEAEPLPSGGLIDGRRVENQLQGGAYIKLTQSQSINHGLTFWQTRHTDNRGLSFTSWGGGGGGTIEGLVKIRVAYFLLFFPWRSGVWGLGPGAWGLESGVWGLGAGGWGLGSGGWGLGAGVWGLEFGVFLNVVYFS